MIIIEIINYIRENWVGWLFAALFAIVGIVYKSIKKMIKSDRAENEAVREGMQALLRDRIIESYNKYSEKGYCPIYAKENVKHMYAPYHALGGNDVATELVEKLLEMPTNPKDSYIENS